MQTKKPNYQDLLLSKLRQNQMQVTVFLMNGFQLRGQIRGFDPFVVLVLCDGKQYMIYKHAISTIIPERTIPVEESHTP